MPVGTFRPMQEIFYEEHDAISLSQHLSFVSQTTSTLFNDKSSMHSRHDIFLYFFVPGLLDVPICAVHDDGFSNDPSVLLKAPSSPERKKLYSFHIPRISSAPYRIFNQNPMLNSHRYPINTITGMSTYPKGFKDLAVASKNREHSMHTILVPTKLSTLFKIKLDDRGCSLQS